MLAVSSAEAGKQSCPRPVVAADIHFALKDEVALITIENAATMCGIAFSKAPARSGESGLLVGTYIWFTAQNGEAFDFLAEPDIAPGGTATGSQRVVLMRGERHVIALQIPAVIREMSRARRASNWTDLPWGQTVHITLAAIVPTPMGSTASGARRPVAQSVSRPFLYRLPARPPG
jgi:hypothetical protein